MNLSIGRGKAVLLVVALGAGGWWWFTRGGGELPKLPPLPIEAPKLGRDRQPEPEPAPRAKPKKAEPEPAPIVDDHPSSGDATTTTTEQPKKRERTPDEKARSSIAVASGYADNGLFDKAFAALDAAEAVGPSAAVLEEVAAARATITSAMREKARSVR